VIRGQFGQIAHDTYLNQYLAWSSQASWEAEIWSMLFLASLGKSPILTEQKLDMVAYPAFLAMMGKKQDQGPGQPRQKARSYLQNNQIERAVKYGW
jgi:hypothetical protein